MSNFFSDGQDYQAMTGAEAAAEAMRQIEPGVVPIFPITPQTPIIEKFAAFSASEKVKSEIITTESEHSVLSAAIGAAASGTRSMTATSSVGLALMYEILGVASGMRLPIVMNVANRALSSPINIHCDHSDTMGVRDSGWIQIYSETAQEVYDNTILAIRLAEHKEVLLPVMVMQDGFITSHFLEKIELLSDEKVKKFIGDYNYPYSLLSSPSSHPRSKKASSPQEGHLTLGSLVLPNYYFETKFSQFQAMEESREVYKKVGLELAKITGREYPEIELFEVGKKTEAVIVVMSAGAGTAKEAAKKLRGKGYRVGVVKIKLFRPFPYQELGEILKNIENIAVLDRTFSLGSVSPLYAETRETLSRIDGSNKNIQSYIFGLGGRDLREKDIKNVYADLLSNNFSKEPKFLNLNLELR